jgi:hypothetical protein
MGAVYWHPFLFLCLSKTGKIDSPHIPLWWFRGVKRILNTNYYISNNYIKFQKRYSTLACCKSRTAFSGEIYRSVFPVFW